jgi:hypothetical protein
MSVPQETVHALPRSAPSPVQWWSWPLVQHPWQSLAVAAMPTAAGLLLGWIMHSASAAILAAVLLLITLWTWFVPTVYELNANGMSWQRLGVKRRIPFSAVSYAETCRRGVYLTWESSPSLLDPFSGMYVPWENHRSAVEEHLRFYLSPPASRSPDAQ